MIRSRDPRGPLSGLRRRVVNRLIEGAFTGLGVAARGAPGFRPADRDVEVFRALRYGPHPRQQLDVYRPKGPVDRRYPVIIYYHGGGFRFGGRDVHGYFALRYAEAGFVTVLPNYRLGPANLYPAQLDDACQVRCWVEDHVDKVGGDPAQVQLSGESAGGNLALSVALAASLRHEEPVCHEVFDRQLSVSSVTTAAGLLQVSDPMRFRRRKPHLPRWLEDEVLASTLNYLGAHRLEGTEASCPLLTLESDRAMARPLPPMFAHVGTADPLLDDTRRLAAALDRRGVPCKTHYFPGERHVFHSDVWKRSARDAWQMQIDFAKAHLQTRA